jgi:hypothetical protein
VTAEPTPVHDEARGDHDRHAAALTPQDLRQWEDLAAELARPHPVRLRRLLEAEADPAAAAPNRVAAWALGCLFPAGGDLDPERLRADAATLGCELVSVGEVLRGWLLVGPISQGLVPEGAVAASLQDQAEERARLQTLARWLRELAGVVLSEETVAAFLALLPDDALAAAFADDAPAEPAPPTDVVSSALNGSPDGADGPQTPGEPPVQPGGGAPDAERAAERLQEAGEPSPSEVPTVATDDDWPAILAEPDGDATEVIEPTDQTQEIR